MNDTPKGKAVRAENARDSGQATATATPTATASNQGKSQFEFHAGSVEECPFCHNRKRGPGAAQHFEAKDSCSTCGVSWNADATQIGVLPHQASQFVASDPRLRPQGESLAEHLLASMGLPVPQELHPPKTRRPRRLNTPRAIVKEIASVVQGVTSGNVKPQEGRAIIYGLQTLLVAMKLANEADSSAQRSLPAGSDPLTIDAVADTATVMNALLDASTDAMIEVERRHHARRDGNRKANQNTREISPRPLPTL